MEAYNIIKEAGQFSSSEQKSIGVSDDYWSFYESRELERNLFTCQAIQGRRSYDRPLDIAGVG